MKQYHLKRAVAAALAALMFLAPAAFATDEPTPAYYRDVEVTTGVVQADLKVNLRSEPNTSSRVLTHVAPGETVNVLDTSNEKWTKVSYNGVIGYLSAEFLQVSTYIDQVEVITEDPLEVTLSGLEAPTILAHHASFTLKGTVHSNIPMIGITVEIIDLRSFETVVTAKDEFVREADVREYNLVKLDNSLPFRRLNAGEKRLRVTVQSSGESVTALEHDFYITGEIGQVSSMTGDCRIEVTAGRKTSLTDNNYNSAWQPSADSDTVTVTLPDGKKGGLVTIEWTRAPSSFTVALAGESGGAIKTIEEANEGGMLSFAYPLTGDVRQIVISTPDIQNGICELRVMEEGKVSPITQQWQPIEGKVDLLIFSAHQDDELLFFGGTIPYYVAKGKNVAVVYMADCGRSRYAEAMAGLWACGLKNHPIFLNYTDKRLSDYEETVDLWGLETTVSAIVELIRKYQPDVIVTHDTNGEYGHNQHKLTSYAVRRAAWLATDAESYPASYENYGVWETKKVYIHLYEANQVKMTAYDVPMEELNGLTATQVATIGYAKHVSQQKYYSMEQDGVRYDNRLYGLIQSAVGDDVLHNDLFENID